MPTYESELRDTRNFQGNVVLRFGGLYYCIREPDSGLSIPLAQRRTVSSLVLNTTTIDPRRVNTTIASYSFTLLDKWGVLSAIVKDTAESVIGQEVEVWVGRTGVGMDFADYYKLPTTKISKVSKIENGYSFSSKEYTDRMNRPLYDKTLHLWGEIVAETATLFAKEDISEFPDAGFLRIGREIISYTSKDDGLKGFYGCARGEFSTTPAAHAEDDEIQIAETVTGNPIDILLEILTSGSGSGAYDLLEDGLAIDPSVIDITGIEALRDEVYPDVEFSFALYSIDNALQWIEKEILAPLNLRFTYSTDQLLTLSLLDKARFVEAINVIDHDSMVGTPQMSVDSTKIVNVLNIEWDYNEATGQYLKKQQFRDEDSITTYGDSQPLAFSFKGCSDDTFVEDFAAALLDRLSTPKPEVEVKTFISKSTLNVADKGRVETTRLPNERGQLRFAADLEILSRAINYATGEVKLKLVYSSFTAYRNAYVSPSDTINSVTSQSVVELAAGRGDLYQVGWKMRLWNNTLNEYESDAPNEITAIDGDEITFANSFDTTLTTHHRLRFADYDQVAESQKRYAFISPTGSDFSEEEKSYKVVS